MSMSGKRKLISVDESTYKSLKEQGQTGDSFSYVIRSVLEKIKPGSKAIIDQEQGDEAEVSKNSNADLHILNDPEISSMIQTIGLVKKVMLSIKEHAATCSCCRDIMMNNDQFDLTKIRIGGHRR